MTDAGILSAAVWLAMLLLSAAFLLTVLRVVRGPTLPDRVVALDMLVGIVIGFIALIAIRTGFTLYVDIAIALGLVGFLATVAFARFILPRVAEPVVQDEPPAAADTASQAKAKPARRSPGKKAASDGKAEPAVASKKNASTTPRGKKKK